MDTISHDPLTAILRAIVREELRAVLAETRRDAGPEYVTLATLPDGISPRAVRAAIVAGELPASKVGKCWTIRTADLRTWVASRATPRVASTTAPANDAYEQSLAIMRASAARREKRKGGAR